MQNNNLNKKISMFDEQYADNIVNQKDQKSAISMLIIYFIMFFAAASFIMLGIQALYLSINHLDPNLINPNNNLFDQNIYDKVQYFVSALGNFITYFITLVICFFVCKNLIITDFKRLRKEKASKVIIYILAGYGFFMIGTLIGSLIQSFLPSEAGNEEGIVKILQSGMTNFIFMTISTVVIAPILEEIVFRKCLFSLLGKRFNVIQTILLSSLIFGGIHIISPTINALTLLLAGEGNILDVLIQFAYLFVYTAMGAGLGLTYQFSKRNVIPGIIIHMFNNFLSVIMTINLPELCNLL